MKINLPIKILIIVIATLLMMFIMLYSVMGIVIFVPSEATGQIIVTKLMENDITSFIPRLYMDKAELEAFLSAKPALSTN